MKFLKRFLIALIVLLLIGYVFLSFSLSNRILFPVSSMDKMKNTIREEWGTTYEDIMAKMPEHESFKVDGVDGIKLSAKYFTKSDSSSCAIIFVHGWGELWAGMLKYVPTVSYCNCDYVFYDHRVHGESEGTFATGSIKESKDLWEVTKWVMENKGFTPDQIAWYGSSWGAATSIMAGADGEDIGVIIADAPFQDWYSAVFERGIKDYGSGIKLLSWGIMQTVNLRAGVNYKEASPLKNIAKVEEPVLLVHSKADSATNYLQSINLSKMLNDRSHFHLTQYGNDHVMDVINDTEAITSIIRIFLKEEAPQFLSEKDSSASVL